MRLPHTRAFSWRYSLDVIRCICISGCSLALGLALLWSRTSFRLDNKQARVSRETVLTVYQSDITSIERVSRITMETWVESFFYKEPPKPQNAPEMRQPSGRSRAIDIFLTRNPSAPARISYSESDSLTTARNFADTIDKPLLDSTVHIKITVTLKENWLTRLKKPATTGNIPLDRI